MDIPGTAQDNGSPDVPAECPICKQAVISRNINDHLDSECKEYAVDGSTRAEPVLPQSRKQSIQLKAEPEISGAIPSSPSSPVLQPPRAREKSISQQPLLEKQRSRSNTDASPQERSKISGLTSSKEQQARRLLKHASSVTSLKNELLPELFIEGEVQPPGINSPDLILEEEVQLLKAVLNSMDDQGPHNRLVPARTDILSTSYMAPSILEDVASTFSSEDELNAGKKEQMEKVREEHPSRLIQIYKTRNAKDAATQTRERATRKHLVLPSQKLNAFDYIKATADDDKVEGLQHTTMGRELTFKNKNKEVNKSLLSESKQKRKLTNLDITNTRAKLSVIARFYHDTKKWLKRKEADVSKRYGIWREQLRFIESRFGSGIVSYFSLYRWVFVMDILFGLMWFIFVTLFGIIQMGQNGGKGWNDFWYTNGTALTAGEFVQQLFSGRGNIERSFFFYGNYKAIVDVSGVYRLDTSYYAVIFAFYFLSFIFIIMRMKTLFVNSRMFYDNVNIDDVSPFGVAIFSGWDFSIRDKEAKTNRNYAISTVIKTLISNKEVSEKKNTISKYDTIMNIIRRVIGNIAVLTLLGFSSVLIWFSITLEQQYPNINPFISISAFVISILTLALPLIFRQIAKYERYTNPANETRINLARSFITKIASIYVILVQFYLKNRGDCWENQLGQIFYQLIWTNLFLTILGTVGYGLYALVWTGKERYDFAITDNILEVIYRQALIWVGTIYSPMLIIMSILTGWITFFIKMFVLIYCGLPPRRIYNSYQQNIYFLFFLLLTLLLMALPVFFGLTTIPPSCGPFGPKEQDPPLSSAYEIIPRAILRMDEGSRSVLNFLTSLSFIIPAFGILSLWVYYLRAVEEKRTRTVKRLQYEVTTERADKRFLLRYYKVKM